MSMHPNNLEAGKLFNLRHGSKVCIGANDLGGNIEDNESKCECMKEHTEMRERKLCTISETTGKDTQGSYSAVVRVIQSKWIFIQRVTTNMGDAFARVKKMIQTTFCLVFSPERKNPSHPS